MDKEFAKYMKYGKLVTHTPDGENYKIVDIEFGFGNKLDKDSVKCVAKCNLNRYELLRAWSNNHVGLTEDQRQEMNDYMVELPFDDLEPANTVRFITPHYENLFEVKDLSIVMVNDTPYRVVYQDETHMDLRNPDGSYGMGTFHICEFAEKTLNHGARVEPTPEALVQKPKVKGR